MLIHITYPVGAEIKGDIKCANLHHLPSAWPRPTETIETVRIDGARELRIIRSIGLPLMVPGMVTVFLLTFVGIWNNFLLPYIMLSNQDLYPLTVGLYTLLSIGFRFTPALHAGNHGRRNCGYPINRTGHAAAEVLAA